MNSVETLSSALKREQRRPVDRNFGQVPITPTIGRMGQYNVVTRGVLRDNTASELSRALSQLPQLLGQARNLSEAAGREQAENLTLDEIEERWKQGDTEAEGFMTWLGGNKAFEEAAYQRIFDANIKPSLTKVSSEIDSMSMADLSVFKADEDISEFVQSKLVGGLDPEILKTIENSPFQAIRHNRAMEAIIPEYTQRAAANINSRKQAFQKKEAIRGISSNIFTGMDVSLDSSKPKNYTDNFQAAITFAQNTAQENGLDKFEIEDALMPALVTQIGSLIEDEKFEEVDLILEHLSEGTTKINGRPINQTLKGVEMITRAERQLELAEEQSTVVKVDKKALDAFELPLLEQNSEFFRAGDFSDEAVREQVDSLNQLRADLDQRTDVNDATLLKMYEVIDRRKASLRGEARVYSEFSESVDNTQKERFFESTGLSSRRLRAAFESSEQLTEIAKEAGVNEDLQSVIVPVLDRDQQKTGEFKISDPMISVITERAYEESLQEVLGGYMNTEDYKTLLQPQATDDLQQKQKEFFDEVNEMFQQRYSENLGDALKSHFKTKRIDNPLPTPTDIQNQQQQAQERDIFLKQAREGGSNFNDKGELVKEIVGSKDGETITTTAGSFKTRIPIMKFNLTKGSNDLASLEGRRLLKEVPVQKKIEFASGLARQASSYTRLTDIGEKLDKTVASVSENILKEEIEKVKFVGLPMKTLTNTNGAVLAQGEYQSGIFGTKLEPWRIRYDAFGNYTNPAETTQRIYNIYAIVNYVLNNDRTDLDRIQSRLLPSMRPETFAENQAKLLEEIYGNLKSTEPQKNNE